MKKKITISFIVLLASLLTTQAQTWTQIGQDIDGEAEYDCSGNFLSLSSDGSIVAIGAHGNDANGDKSGHVRIYQNQNGSWTQIGRDIDGEAHNNAARVSISSDGSTVAVGAPSNSSKGAMTGLARIYRFINGTWTQIGQDLSGDEAWDSFGESLSLSTDGSIVAIGGSGNDTKGKNAGHVRIYQYKSGSWTQIGQNIDGEAAGDQSGGAVSLSDDGSTVAIGAHRNNGNSYAVGHVRIYRYQNGSWAQIGQDIDGEASNDASGWAVDLSADGSTVAIGSHGNDGKAENAGLVRIYQYQNGTWTQIGEDIDGEAEGDSFGWSVSLSADGSVVAIGADGIDGNGPDAGHVPFWFW